MAVPFYSITRFISTKLRFRLLFLAARQLRGNEHFFGGEVCRILDLLGIRFSNFARPDVGVNYSTYPVVYVFEIKCLLQAKLQ